MASLKNKVKKSETPESIAERFDAGEDVFTDEEARNATWKVKVEFPSWMVAELDKMASRLAVPRQAMIKLLVDEGIRNRKRDEKVS